MPSVQPSQGTPTRSPTENREAAGPTSFTKTHDLMTEHQRELGVGQLAVDDVQIGSADRACLDVQAHLPGLELEDAEAPPLEAGFRHR